MGADDYLGKPSTRVNCWHSIHAVLRRRPPQEAPGAPVGRQRGGNLGPFSFDLGTRALQENGEGCP